MAVLLLLAVLKGEPTGNWNVVVACVHPKSIIELFVCAGKINGVEPGLVLNKLKTLL